MLDYQLKISIISIVYKTRTPFSAGQAQKLRRNKSSRLPRAKANITVQNAI
jgi:hypothetical protein